MDANELQLRSVATYTRMSGTSSNFDIKNFPTEQGLYVVSLKLDEFNVVNGVKVLDGDAVAFFHEDFEVYINNDGTLTASYYEDVDDLGNPTGLYIDSLGNLILKYIEDDGNP